MRRKWTLGLAVLAATAAAATTATTVLGGGSEPPPEYTTVDIEVESPASAAGVQARERKPQRKPRRKPTMLYLQVGSTPVDVAKTGPFIDIRLSKCPNNSRVVEGGVVPDNTAVYEQGSYVEGKRAYHVLLSFQPSSATTNFNLTSHLTCIKGVR